MYNVVGNVGGNSSDEVWEIDDISLHQYGWSIKSLSGRFSVPPRRGENQAVVGRHGRLWKPKPADSQTITLAMWLTGGYDPNTGARAADQRLAFNDSWDQLRRLVWRIDGRQFRLTRHMWLTVDATPTLLAADAQAELADTMDLSMTGRTRADFTMTLNLADPFFYGAPVGPEGAGITVPIGTPTTVHNPGMDVAGYGGLVVDLHGPLVNPVLTNRTPNPQVWVKFANSISAGVSIRLKVATYEANEIAAGPTNGRNWKGAISHSGAHHWMGAEPGDNDFLLSADSGTGYAVVSFRPPYL